MHEEPESIPESLIHSVMAADQTDALFSLSDTIITDSIDAIKDSDLLSHFPITRELIGLAKVGFAYRDRRFVSKLLSFLAETSKMSQKDKENFLRKLDETPEKAREAGETILDIIDKITNKEKAIMIGKVIRAYGHESGLSYELMLNMCEIIQRAYLSDLQCLPLGRGYNESNLESVGVIKPIRHEDIEKIVKQAVDAGEYAAIPVKGDLTIPPVRDPKMDRAGFTKEGANLQRILKDY